MKSPTVKVLLLAAMFIAATEGFAQSPVSTYICPDQDFIVSEAGQAMNNLFKDEMVYQLETDASISGIAVEFSKIETWESKYRDYLQVASGYASKLKACSTLYDEGVRAFLNLCDLKKSIQKHPSGVISTAFLNDVYIETATELLTVFSTLDNAIATGGKENMMTGAERTAIIWELDDSMEQLNKKLRQLSICVRMYSFKDMWDSATAGMLDKDAGEITKDALGRWSEAAAAALP